jgi:hypothetical protein
MGRDPARCHAKLPGMGLEEGHVLAAHAGGGESEGHATLSHRRLRRVDEPKQKAETHQKLAVPCR